VSRFIRPEEFRNIFGDVKIDDAGVITFNGEAWAFDVRANLGGEKIDIKGIYIMSSAESSPDPSIPGTVIRVARTHQEIPYKVLSLVFLNAIPEELTLNVETNLSHRRTITLPSEYGREIFVDFSQDDEPLSREDAIEFRPLAASGPGFKAKSFPTVGFMRIVVEDI